MSSEITPENAHLYAQNTAALPTCGVVDPETGEYKEGYTDRKGNLAYRNPLPWWRRMLGQKKTVPLWSEWQYQTTREGKQTMWEGGMFSETKYHEWPTSIHIYRKTHLYTGARRYLAKTTLLTDEIDADIYERTGRVVT